MRQAVGPRRADPADGIGTPPSGLRVALAPRAAPDRQSRDPGSAVTPVAPPPRACPPAALAGGRGVAGASPAADVGGMGARPPRRPARRSGAALWGVDPRLLSDD